MAKEQTKELRNERKRERREERKNAKKTVSLLARRHNSHTFLFCFCEAGEKPEHNLCVEISIWKLGGICYI